MHTYISQRRSERQINPVLGIVLLILLLSTFGGRGAPTTAAQAKDAVIGWLKTDRSPLQTSLGQQVKRAETFSDAAGTPLYYVVYLVPEGFVIVSADDHVEPIIGFAPRGEFDPSTDNPLGALVSNDLPGRIAKVKGFDAAKAEGAFLIAREKWQRLQSIQQKPSAVEKVLQDVSDVRVSPFVQSKWNQLNVGGIACYNYFTPPNSPGSAENYYCGCVATAMAQLMRYYQWPINGVGTASFPIRIKGVATTRNLRGGNGSGGAYSWSDMVLDPSGGVNDTQRQAIGALTHDVGVAVNMDYGDAALNGSAADTLQAKTAFVNTFGYSSAIKGYNAGSTMGAGLNAMVNPNLDAGFPVIFGITGTPGGHATVCDGYGYDVGTLYHHLNLGWSGSDTAWYALPTIDTSQGTFTSLYKCVYNVWPSGTGEIISGRVLDSGGTPVAGAVVTATCSTGGTYTASSDTNGIYALAKIPSASTYTVSASKAGYSFATQTISTELSTDGSAISGNRWNVLITATSGPPVITGQPQSQTVNAGAKAGFSVIAKGMAPLNYQWLFNGQPISSATGSSYFIARVQSIQAGTYTVVVSNAYGWVLSAPAILAIAAGSGTNASAFGIIGAPFSYQIVANYSPTWYSASGLPSGLSCDGDSGLISGTPAETGTFGVIVQAENRFGTAWAVIHFTIAAGAIISGTNSGPVVSVVSDRLTLLAVGSGRVSPNYNNAVLKVGKSYKLTATAGSGNVFSNWVGSVLGSTVFSSNAASLSFTMQSNLVLQANFIPSPFLPAKGAYNGLFSETNRTHGSSGSFTLNLTDRGAYSGNLQLGRNRYSLSGKFGAAGTAGQTILRRGMNSLTVTMALDLTGGADRLWGTVSDGVWLADLLANRAVFGSRTNPATQYAGSYTLSLPGCTNADGSVWLGDGYLTLSVNTGGKVTYSGSLADGTSVGPASVPVSGQGYVPLYVPLYGGKGSVWSWLEFDTSQPAKGLEGLLSWIKPSGAGAYYPAGLTGDVMAEGARYTPPTTGSRVIELTDGLVILESGSLSGPLINAVTLTANNKVIDLSLTNKLSLTVKSSSGAFSGSVTEPGAKKPHSFKGALLQDENRGYGYFLGINYSGSVILLRAE